MFARPPGEIGNLLPTLGHYHVVVVKSTVVPTTTDTVVRSELEAASGMVVAVILASP